MAEFVQDTSGGQTKASLVSQQLHKGNILIYFSFFCGIQQQLFTRMSKMLHAVNINYECQLRKNSSLYFLLNNSFSKEKRKSMGFSVMMVSK